MEKLPVTLWRVAEGLLPREEHEALYGAYGLDADAGPDALVAAIVARGRYSVAILERLRAAFGAGPAAQLSFRIKQGLRAQAAPAPLSAADRRAARRAQVAPAPDAPKPRSPVVVD